MTYNEVKDQIKVGDYWLVHWENDYLIGYVGYIGTRLHALAKETLGLYFPGSNIGYYPATITEYIRKIDIPESKLEQ